MLTKQLNEGGVRAREYSVPPGGISSASSLVIHLDGGAARIGVGKVSLFSNFIGGRPTVGRGEIYKTYSLYIMCVNLYVFAFVERPCAVWGVSDSPTSDVSLIAREKPDFG